MKKLHGLFIATGIAIFLIGMIFGIAVNYYSISGFSIAGNSVLEKNNSVFLENVPMDRLNEDNILVYPDKIVLKIEGAGLSNYDSTGSMKPTLDKGVNGIVVKPNSEEDVRVGDIIAFRSKGHLIVHRVVAKGVDENGAYFETKGDSNNYSDGKVRFSEIEYVTIGLIY